MKRALLASILGIAASVATTFGQGSISFNNYTSTLYNQVKYAVNAALGANSGLGVLSPTVQVQLFWVLGATADPNAVVNAGVTDFINPLYTSEGGGYYDGPNQTITGFNAGGGQTVSFLVRAWETTGPFGGATFASSNLRGTSAIWTETQASVPGNNGIAVGSDPVGSFLIGPPDMFIDIVPEPSTFALAGLGLGSLLVMVRRRK